MEKENIIVSKSYEFSIRIVKLHQQLHKERHFELSSQLLRSGTSIGANVKSTKATN
jgi:four helix bundle protein